MTALHAAGGGLPLALHIPHVVEQAGSVAGFAAVLGLAVLSALYFSQARDLRRLREWAGRAPERAAEGQPAPVPGRVVAVPQQRPATPPAPASTTAADVNGDAAPAVTAGAAGAAVAQPADAPAKAADAGEEKPDGEPEADGQAAAADAPKDGEAKPESETPEDAKPDASPSPPRPGMPAPASAAAAAAGAGAASVTGPSASAPAPRPSAQPQRPPGSVLPPRTGTLPPVRRLPSSNVGAPTGGPVSAPPPKKKRNPLYVVLAIAGVLILGAAAAVGVPAIVNGTKNDKPSTSAKKTSTTATKKKAAPVAPDKITVAVLNGTAIPGLAAQIGDRVDAEGFTLGTVSNASQTQGQRANSVAMYAAGHERDARAVARKLNIRNVQPIDAGSRGIAGDASVVVIVGSDKTQ